MFTCVLSHHLCSDTCAQVFQESLGVLLTPQLVPPPQDCCAFWLVALCTVSTVEAVSRCMWLPPTLNVCLTHHIYTPNIQNNIDLMQVFESGYCTGFLSKAMHTLRKYMPNVPPGRMLPWCIFTNKDKQLYATDKCSTLTGKTNSIKLV